MKKQNSYLHKIEKSIAVVMLFLAALCFSNASTAQTPTGEYRAYWAETFNTQMGTRAEIDRLVDSAVQSNANAIFAQVRRRGDSWYLDTKEPLTQVTGVGEPDSTGKWTIDPLKYLIQRAHERGIEVHAFVIVGSIYNGNPTVPSSGVPRDPNHVFNQHFWDSSKSAPYTDARQWSTRSLPHHADGTTFNGQRYTAEWYVDLGHPEAAAYTVDVLTHLVKQYDLDGLHLDRIRYPEAPIDRPVGQPLGINVGYNETSVQRFKARYGDQATYYTTADIGTNVNTAAAPRRITAADVGYPKTNDPKWNDWRREQVTNVVRRIYLNATAVKPNIKVSAALICFWTGPTASGGWEKTEAYYRVFQDWRAWTQEGILDIIAPMIYKQEHLFAPNNNIRAQYDDWLAFTKQLARDNNRLSLPGLGVYLNGIEGSLLQARRALARPPYETANTTADGVIFYALGSTISGTTNGNSTSAAVTNNPFSYPTPGVSTPKRTNNDFFAALRTGASANGATRFENLNLAPLFPAYISPPEMPWKSQPTKGYAMGISLDSSGNALDGATVTIKPTDGSQSKTVKTDGSGFWGVLNLAPGTYRSVVQLGNKTFYSLPFEVIAGQVANVETAEDTTAPETAAIVTPTAPNGVNGWYTSNVTITLTATDDLSGVTTTEYSTDGATWQPYTSSFVVNSEGVTTIHYRSTDQAGNTEQAKNLTVKLDKTAPKISITAKPDRIFPPNGKMIDVQISGSGSDAVSGLAQVSYVVTDEYGTPLSIPARSLTGNSASWTETLQVEARREGEDRDGRRYLVTATITDVSGQTATATKEIVVLHDQRP
ncbi:MAG: family 10 glycosylhydrolase [Acidobacteriota bacterium]|nr:family 10 glycosylhydrolase [Acidobacteriota bacterium]